MKHLNISRSKSSSGIDKNGAAWERKVRALEENIKAYEYALSEEWCVGEYALNNEKMLNKAKDKLAKLLA